jgi:hypothetical protein
MAIKRSGKMTKVNRNFSGMTNQGTRSSRWPRTQREAGIEHFVWDTRIKPIRTIGYYLNNIKYSPIVIVALIMIFYMVK